ncbi:MAG TPA: helix-turn-helix domain-containing protein, partial [Ktedonobacterales bacterium]|nr:helix-turn-helix domain-containing protein [Ktedonobacterales bacterium]
MTTEDLAAFCGVSHSTMSRCLAHLGAQGLVEWVAPACLVHSGARRLYHLSNLGINLLAAGLNIDAKTLARTWDCDEKRLLQRLPQLSQFLRVQTLIRGLLRGAPQAFGEQGHEASGTWHWVRNYRQSFSFRNRTHILRLDAAVTLHVTGTDAGTFNRQERWTQKDDWYAALVLAATPLQDWRAAARTLDTLISFRESPERWPVY